MGHSGEPGDRHPSDGCDREQRDRLEKEVRDLKKERDDLQRERDVLQREQERLEKQARELQDEINKLRALLDSAQRAAKRQAAPFSKGSPKSSPKPPGRRAGKEYGVKAHRPVPEHWDEELEAQLPRRCDCGGELEELKVESQYQTDIPPIQPRVARINVHIGRCRRCGKRAQGRHPRQVSDALGAAASHLGPTALALAAYLNKGLGMPFGKVSALFETHFSLSVTPGGLCLALHRVRRALTPSYEAIASLPVVQLARSPVSGGRVGIARPGHGRDAEGAVVATAGREGSVVGAKRRCRLSAPGSVISRAVRRGLPWGFGSSCR